jgi:hypothetical protein
LRIKQLTKPVLSGTVDHNECNRKSLQGCSRCKPRHVSWCCDLCNPDQFKWISDFTFPKPPRAKPRSKLDPYEVTDDDRCLKKLLLDWRVDEAKRVMGAAAVKEYGPWPFMPNEVLNRLVDCSHYNKITSLTALRVETQWLEKWVTRCGDRLMAILEPFNRPPPAPNTNSTLASHKKLHTVTCSACGNVGHKKNNAHCPARVATHAANSENVAPLRASPTSRLKPSTPCPRRRVTPLQPAENFVHCTPPSVRQNQPAMTISTQPVTVTPPASFVPPVYSFHYNHTPKQPLTLAPPVSNFIFYDLH